VRVPDQVPVAHHSFRYFGPPAPGQPHRREEEQPLQLSVFEKVGFLLELLVYQLADQFERRLRALVFLLDYVQIVDEYKCGSIAFGSEHALFAPFQEWLERLMDICDFGPGVQVHVYVDLLLPRVDQVGNELRNVN